MALHIDRASMLLSLRGRAKAVADAQLALDALLDVDAHERLVPPSAIPVIIGKGGSNIRRLKEESGATFDLSRDTGRLRVNGTAAQVASGCALLDALLAANSSVAITVLPRQIPLIIGRGGANIKLVQADSGAVVDIRKDESVVNIRGTSEQCEAARGLIERLLNPQATQTQMNGKANGHAPGANGVAHENGEANGVKANGVKANVVKANGVVKASVSVQTNGVSDDEEAPPPGLNGNGHVLTNGPTQ